MRATRRGVPVLARTLLALLAPGAASAQPCTMPDGFRQIVPVDPPEREWGALPVLGPVGVPLGIGLVRRADPDPSPDGPPGSDDWIGRLELPLSRQPGAEPFAWIARRWVVRPGMPPEALIGLVETGYEEPSFIALERRDDGWMRLRYAPGEGDAGTAWVHACALGSGPERLELTDWAEWLLRDDLSPLFLRSQEAGRLHAEPSTEAGVVAELAGDYALHPLEIRGEWMRVELEQPSSYCAPDASAARREGWVRWLTPERGPEVWYFTRGC